MKGCARAALLQLAGYLATVAAVMFLLRARFGFSPPKTIGVSLACALFVVLGLGLLFGIAKPVREKAALRDCLAGRRPEDGKRAGIAGTIDTPGQTLRSPLSAEDCLAWRYEVYEFRGHGKSRRRITYFEGVAIVPSVVTTPSGTYRLLAVPTFDFGGDGVEAARAARNAAEHVKTAAFEPESSRRTLEKEWTDDDGAYHCEKKIPLATEVPWETCQFREQLVRRGDPVYVVGLFSESRGGIVPDPNWANITRIMKGDGETVLRQLRARIVRYAVGSVVSLAAAAGVLALFLR